MGAIETPVGKCFSRDGMSGAYYHEHTEPCSGVHAVHRYDADGNYVQRSTIKIECLGDRDDFYVSDRHGNKIEKKIA